MNQITKLSTSSLHIHPENTKFFDDIEGEQYKRFKKSIEEDGVLTPLIIAPDMTIISGHQRYKACKDLGINLVPVIIREDLVDEDEKRKKLLATNFGRLKNDPVKQGRVYCEYEKLCGIKNGGYRKSDSQIAKLTQKDIAKELGVSVDTIIRLKKLNTLSPELQDLISNGTVKYTTALNVWAKLPNDEQVRLINDIGKETISNMKARETQQYIDKIRNLEKELENEKNKEPIVKEVEKVIDNTDYETINRIKNIIKIKEDEINKIKQQKRRVEDRLMDYRADSEEYQQLKDDIAVLTEKKTSLGRQLQGVQQTTELMYDVDKLLKLIAPTKYSQSIFAVKDDEVVMENLNIMIELVRQWCDEMQNLISPYNNNIYVNAEVIE